MNLKRVSQSRSVPDGTFSHEPIFQEYREAYNRYFGEMTDSLNYWHFGRNLSGNPALNSSFIECTPNENPFAQTATDNILGMFKHKIAARRMVKKSVKPVGLI